MEHIRDHQVHMLYSEMQTGRKHKMQTMDQVLLEFYQQGDITYDVAITNAHEPDLIRHRTGQLDAQRI